MSEQYPNGASRIPTDAQRQNVRDKGKLGLKHKPKRAPRTPRWSHQHDLDNAVGKRVVIRFSGSDDCLEGKLIAADQFAVKMVTPETAGEEIIFKHEIGSFRVEE